MKNLLLHNGIILTVFLFIFKTINIIAQIVPPPAYEWKKETWSNTVLGANIRPESGENWWFSHKNLLSPSNQHIGYIAGGYTGFFFGNTLPEENAIFSIYNEGVNSCFNTYPIPPPGITSYTGNCTTTGDLAPPGKALSSVRGVVSRLDLSGNIIWETALTFGDINEIIQVGNFIYAIGTHNGAKNMPKTSFLRYNPTPSNLNNTFDLSSPTFTNCNSPNGVGAAKAYIAKLDLNGNIIWENLYGYVDYNLNTSSEIWNALGYGSDIILNSDGYLYATSFHGFLSGGNTVLQGLVLKIDPITGYLINKALLPMPTNLNTFGQTYKWNVPQTICEIGNTGNMAIGCKGCFTYFAGIGPDEYRAVVYSIGTNLALNPGWSTNPIDFPPLSPPTATNKQNSNIYEVNYHSTNNEVLCAVMRECNFCFSAGDQKANGEIHRFNNFGNTLGIIGNNPLLLGSVNAFDLRIGIIKTGDGGFAAVSSRSNGAWAPPIPAEYGPYTCFSTYEGYFDTDPLIVKFDATGNKLWEWSEDVLPGRSRQTPLGDIKRQECLYKVTEAGDGGLVVSGNSSNNNDDYYMVKLNPDCSSGCVNTLNGVINTNPLPNSYCVTGNITINSDIYFIKSDFKINPGVTIFVSPTGTLNIFGSHLHGCSELWQGIVVQPGGVLNITNSAKPVKTSFIEDAKVAVDILDYTLPSNAVNILSAHNVTFNRNLINIRIGKYQKNQTNYPFTITSCLFTSRAIPYSTLTWPLTNSIKNSPSGNASPLKTPYISPSYIPKPINFPNLSTLTFPTNGIVLNFVGLTLQPGGLGYQFKEISIGQNGSFNFNCFDNLQEDITSTNTNLTIINTVFQNGRRFGGPFIPTASGGAAIVAKSFAFDRESVSTKNQIRILDGGGNGNFNCRFYEKTVCASISNYFNTVIQNAKAYSFANDFSFFNDINVIGETGFNIETTRYLNIDIQNNQFYNIKNAMLIGLDNAVVFGSTFREIGFILVQNNSVNRYLGAIPGGSYPYVNIGLSIADPFAIPTSTMAAGSVGVVVNNNNFNQVHNGVNVINFSQSPVGITSNTVLMINQPPTPLNPNLGQIGIFGGQLMMQASINLNNVSGPIAYNSSMKAISTAFNASLSVRCNTTASTTRGIEFNKPQTMDFFEDNWMSNETYGLVLDNSAKLTTNNLPSFVLGSAIRPTNNVWQHPWSGSFKTLTTGGSSAQDGKLYVTWQLPSGGNLDPDGSGDNIGGNFGTDRYYHSPLDANITLLPASPVPMGCRISTIIIGAPNNQNLSVSMLERIAVSGFNYPNNPVQNNAIDKTLAYRILKANPALMIGSPTLTSFYNSAQTSSLQNMVSIEENLSDGNINIAQGQIAALTPTNSVQTNYKNFYQIFKSTKDSTFNSNDSLSLITLANMCPYVDGAVVFQARALYNILYNGFYPFSDNCNPVIDARGVNTNNVITGIEEEKGINVILKSTLYPNPNNGNYVLKFNKAVEKQNVEISIFDISDKLVFKQRNFVDTGTALEVSNDLLNGTYLVKVKLDDGTIDMHRLIISK